jgi:hypothetical protein
MGLSGDALWLSAEMPKRARTRSPDLKIRLAETCNRIAESVNIAQLQ